MKLHRTKTYILFLATFKWSRWNGVLVGRVNQMRRDPVEVERIARLELKRTCPLAGK